MRIALRLEYEGTDFHGSQLQAHERTVQSELEGALETLFQEHIRPHFASRTDAGVHAEDQVAAFNIETKLEMDTIRNALNYHLPADLAVRLARRVSPAFQPRRDALEREYLYVLNDSPARSPIRRRFEALARGPLDERAMCEAGQTLKGPHDFAAFAGPATPKDASTVRQMNEVDVSREGDHLLIRFNGNAFLHQQVRRMAATLVAVGRRMMSIEQFQRLIDEPVRGSAKRVMPPQGLCLMRIAYPRSGPGAFPVGS